MMHLRSCLITVGTAIALVTVSAAAVDPPLPEFYGLYAIAEGKLYSLDTADPALGALARPLRISRTEKDFTAGGGATVSVPTLPPSVNFLVYVKGNALQAASQLSLRQLPFIRTMVINANDRNWRRAYQLDSWVSTTEFGYANVGTSTVELRFKPVKGQDEMVVAVPSAVLGPGLYRLGGDFLFSVPPLDAAAESSRCIDATNGAAMGPWTIVRCSEVAASPSALSAPLQGGAQPVNPGELGTGFSVTGEDVPLFSSAEGSEIKARLAKGTVCANAKGRFLNIPKEYRLEEQSGRTHVAYLQEGRLLRHGWVDSGSLVRFTYDCSCSPVGCDPVDISLRKGASWNECFQRALSARTAQP